MKLKTILEKKRETEVTYQDAFESMIKQTEEQSQVILNQYFYVKKLRKREKETKFIGQIGKCLISDEPGPMRNIKMGKFLENLSINEILFILDKDLIQKQMNLTQKLERSYKIVMDDMIKIFEELSMTILGEHGLKKIDEFFTEFFIKFQEEALHEAEKYEKVNRRVC
jgi:hypothetical protein